MALKKHVDLGFGKHEIVDMSPEEEAAIRAEWAAHDPSTLVNVKASKVAAIRERSAKALEIAALVGDPLMRARIEQKRDKLLADVAAAGSAVAVQALSWEA